MNAVEDAISYFDEKLQNKSSIIRQNKRRPVQKDSIKWDNAKPIPYLNTPGSSSKYIGMSYETDKDQSLPMHDNSTARFK